MAASSSSVISMARLNWVVSVVLKVAGRPSVRNHSPFSVARISPGRLKVLDALILNEPYTTVSLARPTMAASSSSVMSMAFRKLPVSPVLNCGDLP
jgi:hypothetical protein